MEKECILVSACLLGENCKYNGKNNYNENVINFLKGKRYIKICPEVFAGFSIPRLPIEILNGRVIREDGLDVTYKMDNGCKELEKIIKEHNPNIAILKSRSPSCGYKEIYDGTFSHTLTNANGKACECILKHNIKVYTEEDFK